MHTSKYTPTLFNEKSGNECYSATPPPILAQIQPIKQIIDRIEDYYQLPNNPGSSATESKPITKKRSVIPYLDTWKGTEAHAVGLGAFSKQETR